MPEGPEVRKYADAIDKALSGRTIVSLQARTKEARKWLQDGESQLIGRRVERVVSHGKHLIGYIEGDFFFHSHLMMWGRWQTFGPTRGRSKSKSIELPEKDRRERARIVVEGAAAILLSAPIFNVGEGDPYDVIEILATLGPDALPYRGRFDRKEFLRRLAEHEDETIGAALLNQRIVAGLGNYLRAEILFNCKLNPWCLDGRTCRVCGVGRRFDSSGKELLRLKTMRKSARGLFIFVRSAKALRTCDASESTVPSAVA